MRAWTSADADVQFGGLGSADLSRPWSPSSPSALRHPPPTLELPGLLPIVSAGSRCSLRESQSHASRRLLPGQGTQAEGATLRCRPEPLSRSAQPRPGRAHWPAVRRGSDQVSVGNHVSSERGDFFISELINVSKCVQLYVFLVNQVFCFKNNVCALEQNETQTMHRGSQ